MCISHTNSDLGFEKLGFRRGGSRVKGLEFESRLRVHGKFHTSSDTPYPPINEINTR